MFKRKEKQSDENKNTVTAGKNKIQLSSIMPLNVKFWIYLRLFDKIYLNSFTTFTFNNLLKESPTANVSKAKAYKWIKQKDLNFFKFDVIMVTLLAHAKIDMKKKPRFKLGWLIINSELSSLCCA